MPAEELLYSPPANIGDFDDGADPDELKRAWHMRVQTTITKQCESQTSEPSDPNNYPGERSFFDALGSSVMPTPVPWFAFPEAVKAWYPDDDEKRWEAADTLFPMRGLHKAVIELVTRGHKKVPVVKEVGDELELYYRQQDEYCEWFVHKDSQTGSVTRVDFTAENPDYWDELATNDINLAVTLYRRYVSPDVQPTDLIWQHGVVDGDDAATAQIYAFAGDYNRLNKWTTTHGVMHLTHPANNLFAEIVLAAQATVQRESPDGQEFDATTLACCAGYGGVRRSSDPTIGYKVNQLVAKGNRVALADPVGLYIAALDRSSAGTWEVPRGSEADKRILRASFTPDGDASIRYGGELADNMLMNLYAIAENRPDRRPPSPEPCRGRCCTYPGRPGVQEFFPTSDCSRVPWNAVADDFIPFPRDEAVGAVAAATSRPPRDWSQPPNRTFTANYADL